MTLTCKKCGLMLEAGIPRSVCPGCGDILRPSTPQVAFIADEDRPFRAFLVAELGELGFDVELFSSGEGLLEKIRQDRPALLLANVYLDGMLGVEICERVKSDTSLNTRVLLIGAIFRPDRFKARPTSLYGADGYCEEGLSSAGFQEIVGKVLGGRSQSVAGLTQGSGT